MKAENTALQQKKKRQKRRRRKRLFRRILSISLVVAAIVLGITVLTSMQGTEDNLAKLLENPSTVATTGGRTSNVVVQAPVDYSDREIREKLQELAQEQEVYEKIQQQRDSYPDGLLKDLVNNSEMLDFVENYTTEDTASGKLTSSEKHADCPLLLQWDERWGYHSYGESIMAISGCGPTALSMVVIGLTGNTDATPNEVADYAMNNGYYMYGTGTSWSLMSDGAAHYGLSSQEVAADEAAMKQVLDEQGYLICSMRSGDFTTAGHFIVICGYDDEGFQVNDPFCIYRSSLSWSYDTIAGQIKNIWGLKKHSLL